MWLTADSAISDYCSLCLMQSIGVKQLVTFDVTHNQPEVELRLKVRHTTANFLQLPFLWRDP